MMQVKLFDFEHEEDLEEALNDFLATLQEENIVEVKYQVAVADNPKTFDTVFCFSAMVIYRSS